ncbi:ferric reductase like transmembrane component-domain-containing protein [Lipomyces chichibuensis]|uniref:ferric reductase like transmembrane component-domain-containing protein n=1 Tax=Lipomyces chichibuensis TaxID=1546026 RepID=UPI0033440892
MQSLAIIGIFLMVVICHSQFSTAETSCNSACQNFLETFTTECEVDDFACMCTDDIYFQALTMCANSCNHRDGMESIWKYLSKKCMIKGSRSWSNNDLEEQLEDYVDQKVVSKKESTVTDVFVVAEDLALGVRARSLKSPNELHSEYYVNILTIYWIIPIIISFICLTALRLYPGNGSKPGRLVTFFRKRIMLPATFSRKHVSPIRFFGVSWMIMPLRWQTLLIVGFVLLNFVLIFVHRNIIPESHEAWTIQVVRFYANRSGIMATTMIPLLFLFGGRNNIMIAVTGWSHETFNMFHRWIGRMMFFQSLVHGVGFTSYYIMDGGYEIYYYNMYQPNLWGIIILILAGAIMLQAAYPFRHYWYETFLVGHVVLVAVFLPGLHSHLANHGYHNYTYAALAIWMFDRFLRIVRVIFAGTTTQAEINAHGDATHLIIKPNIHFKAQPGQYAFLYVMRHKFWESHPFSIMDTKADGSYIFVAKAQAGMTRRLLESAAHVHGNDKIRVWVEGPYGKTYPLARYETVLLIAGGIGVTAVMSYALDLKRRARSGQHEQLDEVSQDGFVDIRIFITAEWSTNSSTSDVSNEKSLGNTDSDSCDSDEHSNISGKHVSICSVPQIVAMNYGQRPDMRKVIQETIKQAHGSVAVMSCGPGSLVDTCRSAVADNVDKGTGRVDYFEDAFSCV